MIIKWKKVEWEYQNKGNLLLSYNNFSKKNKIWNKELIKKNNIVKCCRNCIPKLAQWHRNKLLIQSRKLKKSKEKESSTNKIVLLSNNNRILSLKCSRNILKILKSLKKKKKN